MFNPRAYCLVYLDSQNQYRPTHVGVFSERFPTQSFRYQLAELFSIQGETYQEASESAYNHLATDPLLAWTKPLCPRFS